MDIDEPWWEWIDRKARRRVLIDYLMEFSGVAFGLIAATLSICDPKANSAWGIFGWVFAFVSTIKLLSIKRRKRDAVPGPMGWQVGAALIAVFCMTFLAIMIAAVVNSARGLEELGGIGIVVCLVLTSVGMASGWAAVSMALK